MDGLAGTLPFLALLALALLILFRGSRQRRELEAVQRGLTVGAEVMTASGMFGTITALDDTVVTLQTAPGQTSRWDRRAVARIVSASGSSSEPENPAT